MIGESAPNLMEASEVRDERGEFGGIDGLGQELGGPRAQFQEARLRPVVGGDHDDKLSCDRPPASPKDRFTTDPL